MIPLTVAEPFKRFPIAAEPMYQVMSGVPVDFALEQVIALLDAVDCSLSEEIGGGEPCPVLTRFAVRAAMASVESVLMGISVPDRQDQGNAS